MRAFFKSLAWLEPVIELARMAIFAAFVALVVMALVAAVRRSPERGLRRRANLLIAYVLAISTLIGLIQVDSWPFTTWSLVHTRREPLMHSYQFEATDAGGGVHVVDLRVLQPIAPEEFGGWVRNLPRLPPAARTDVARFVYERAESARQRLRSGGRFPRNDWLLGPLSAPYLFEARRRWRGPEDVPAVRFVSLRIVFIGWDLNERYRRGASVIKRRVVAEYRPNA